MYNYINCCSLYDVVIFVNGSVLAYEIINSRLHKPIQVESTTPKFAGRSVMLLHIMLINFHRGASTEEL